ncbi:MAG: hypothetical protein ACI9AA_002852, partial [Alteromonas sp.]
TCGRLRSATTTDRASHNTSDRVYQNWGDREAGISDREMPNTHPLLQFIRKRDKTTTVSIFKTRYRLS